MKTLYYGSDPAWEPANAERRAAARRWLKLPPDRPLALFVGGFGYDERKGFDTLWQAWQQLHREGNWDVDLIAAGGGRTLPHWQERVRQSPLAGRVHLIGFTDRIVDVLAAADVLVSPTRYEPYGLNVQEAICMGLPAIVSQSAGVAEQYPEEFADLILADPNDSLQLVACLRRWRSQSESWRARFQPLGGRLRAYTLVAMAKEFVAIVEAGRTCVGV